MCELMKKVGFNIKKLRDAQGYSQKQLADEINYTPSYLSRIENGACTCSLDVLYTIAEALNVSIHSLLPDSRTSTSDEDEQDVILVELTHTLRNAPLKYQQYILHAAQTLLKDMPAEE